MNNQLVRSVTAMLLLFCLLAVARQTLGVRSDWGDQLDLLIDVRHQILQEYVEEVDETKMVEDAARAMLESLGDPHSSYVNHEQSRQFEDSIRGSFPGIGALVEIKDNRPHIVSPLDGSPAFRAGVLAGDAVLSIDGKDTLNMSINDAVDLLRGPKGTKVTIRVRHENGEEADISIVRDVINVPTVRGLVRQGENNWRYLIDEDQRIAYVRVSQFGGSTTADLREALQRIRAQGARGVILDLRSNPGGLLESAVDIANLFLEGGKRIVSVKGRRTSDEHHESVDSRRIIDFPVVVLVNEASASASEIVAGALKYNNHGLVVGTRTYGKGSVQKMIPLGGNRGQVKITHAYYFLPNGENIHRRPDAERWGVDPNDGCYVPMTIEQVRRMLEVRRRFDTLHQNGGDTLPEGTISPDWFETEFADPQLAAGLRALQGKLHDGTWPKVGEDGTEVLVKQQRRDALLRQRDAAREVISRIDSELAKLEAGDNDTDADTGADAAAPTQGSAVDVQETDVEPVPAP